MSMGQVSQERREQIFQILLDAQKPLSLRRITEAMRAIRFEEYSFWIPGEIARYIYQLKKLDQVESYGNAGRRLYKAVMSNREEK